MFILLAIFSIFYIIAVLLLLKGLYSLPQSGDPSGLKFSVIIAARNEEKNLPFCLDSVFKQSIDSERYEVIVVNDRSCDQTAKIVTDYSSRFTNLTLINVEETPAGISPKKHAVCRGIEISHNEIIVFTDADCRVPETWLDSIDRNFSPETGLLQGITTYERPSDMNKLFFGLQAVDFLSHGIVAAAGIGIGMPVNSNANNMAFRREAFENCGGYGRGAAVVSGDDDLLLQRIWESGKWKIKFMRDLKGAVVTAPTTTLRGVFEQRKRWGSKTVHYNLKQVIFLSSIFIFYLSLPLSLLCGFFDSRFFAAFAALILTKSAGEMILMLPGTRIFGRTELRRFILPGSLIQLPVVLAAVLAGVFGRFRWKDQDFTRTVADPASN